MKRLLFVFVAILLLAGCGNTPKETVKEDPMQEEIEKEKQKAQEKIDNEEETEEMSVEDREKLNNDIKEKAVEYDYMELFRNEVAEGEFVKFTGEASQITKEGILGEFALEINLEKTKAPVSITDITMDDSIEIEIGKKYTVYGMFMGREDKKAPKIAANVIEESK
ncbi:hypothetical protein J14TS2_17350 [Bacillus sp. J14TS2]|uniref:lipoprotein n=1 Tax=Bacillus sp. J14TS2 TaxID=2807188 RepID=UPI001B2CF305|nr:membrane lipoprotein lipid attachment site-containing protein [Bacillus sp. J14TS2]GIN71260.1 hypothetical protein J14TS2_17350 [Bacillus sp. J14TS2]